MALPAMPAPDVTVVSMELTPLKTDAFKKSDQGYGVCS